MALNIIILRIWTNLLSTETQNQTPVKRTQLLLSVKLCGNKCFITEKQALLSLVNQTYIDDDDVAYIERYMSMHRRGTGRKAQQLCVYKRICWQLFRAASSEGVK